VGEKFETLHGYAKYFLIQRAVGSEESEIAAMKGRIHMSISRIKRSAILQTAFWGKWEFVADRFRECGVSGQLTGRGISTLGAEDCSEPDIKRILC
jgi:hypothetical protein